MNLILFNEAELNTDEYPGEVTVHLLHRDERAVHLLKVLHKGVGSSFTAGVLGGKTGSGIIAEIGSTGLLAALNLDNDPPRRTPLRLGAGFPRPIQLRRLLRDCASLGLTAVDLVGTELGEKSYRDTKLLNDGGAHSALVEGAIQARDTRLPGLAVYPTLSEWLQMVTVAAQKVTDTVLLAADNVRPQGSFSGLGPLQPGAGVVLAIGPERGWSDREREQLEGAGYFRLSLGERALRTETACVAAAVLVMEKMNLL